MDNFVDGVVGVAYETACVRLFRLLVYHKMTPISNCDTLDETLHRTKSYICSQVDVDKHVSLFAPHQRLVSTF